MISVNIINQKINMRKLYILGMILGMYATFSACNDEWKDELYTQMLSFKAPLGDNGLSEIYVRYQPDGTGIYQLPVIVSGSKSNSRNIDAKIAVDEDTLRILNQEKFPVGRQDLWYVPLAEQHYSFESNICHIPAGENIQLYPIHFNFNGLELDEKYVLPLTIEEDPSYVQNKYKGRYKALLGVNLFNDYSGTYNTTLMNIYIEGTTTDPAKVDTRLARVVDENTIFFYAGSTWVEDENRSRYKVFVEFEEGTEDEEGTIKGKLRLYGDEGEPGINIRPLGECKYEKRIIQHETIKYMERHLTTLELSYKYIMAGKKKLQETRSVRLQELLLKAQRTNLAEDAQAAKDMDAMCSRFEKKIHDLELTRTISLQTAPQIRMVQSNDTLMAEKIQSTIVNTIPLWKSQMVLALGVEHSARAAEVQREVTDMTNELLKKNAKKLQMAAIESAKESERGIVELETLKHTNETLITTLDEVMKIQQEGRQKRAEAEQEIYRMEQELKTKLLKI